ncbi:MAG: hypothetical protein PGN26_05185 [Xylophilus ampelinus]
MNPSDKLPPGDATTEEDRTNARGEQVARASFNRSPTNDPDDRGSATEAPGSELPHDEGLRPGGAVDGGNAGLREAIDLDDDEIYSGRGKQARTGGTTDADGGDSGRLGPPAEQLSDSNAPQEKNLP